MRALFAIFILIITWLGLLIFNNYGVFSSFPQFVTFPRLELETPENLKYYTENDKLNEHVIEKFTHEQEDGKDVKNGLYLKFHKFFFDEIATKTIQLQERKFSLNDICFKPHHNYFHKWKKIEKPQYVERLELEAKRLSPCLIVSPLNCFHDSYRLHSDISLWKYEVNYLNRRLRDSYLEAISSKETKPYVKANDGLTLIEKWSELMNTLSQKPGHEKENVPREWIETVRKWTANMKPTSSICADPIQSCDSYQMEDINYSKMCSTMELDKDSDWKKTGLDCIEDREKFIDWIQIRELESIYNFLLEKSTNGSYPTNYEQILSQSCSGIFQADIDFFGANRHFSNRVENNEEENTENIMKFEIVLLKPEQVMEQLNEKARINKVDSKYTIEEAEEIVNELRGMFRDEVTKFNDREVSKKFGMRTSVLKDPRIDKIEFSGSGDIRSILLSTLIFFCIVMGLGSFLLWENNRMYSTITFTIRVISGVFVFFNVFATGGTLMIRKVFLFHFLVLISFNVILTTIISNMKVFKNDRKRRRIGNQNENKSLRSLTSGSSVSNYSNWSVETVIDSLDRIMRKEKMRRQRQDDNETNDTSTRWHSHPYYFLWTMFLAYFTFVWVFDDGTQLEILVPTMSSFLFFVIEWCFADWELRKYHEFVENQRKGILQTVSQSRDILAASVESVRGSKERSAEDIGMGNYLMETINSERLNSSRHSFENSPRYRRSENIFARTARNIKFHSLNTVFQVIFTKKLIPIVTAVIGSIILLSIVVVFLPISQRIPNHQLSQTGEDLFFGVQFNNFSKFSKDRLSKLERFTDGLETIENLHLISNWQKEFTNFLTINCTESVSMENRCGMILNGSSSVEFGRSFANLYPKWFRTNPIVSSIVTTNGRPTEDQIQQESFTPNRFTFSMRYEILKSTDENDRKSIEKVGELVDLVNLNPEDCLVTVDGTFYSTYQQYHQVWNKYLAFELATSFIFLLLLTAFAKVVFTNFSWKLLLLFSLLLVSIKFEMSAFIWIISGELVLHHMLFTNTSFAFALLVFGRLMLQMNKFETKKNKMEFEEKMKATRPIFSEFLEVSLLLVVLLIGSFFLLLMSVFYYPNVLFSYTLVTNFIFLALLECLLILLVLSRFVIGDEVISAIEGNSQEFRNKTDLIKKVYFRKRCVVESIISSRDESCSRKITDEEISLEESGSIITEESSEEEDIDSCGECDEEVLAVMNAMHARWREQMNIPSTSSRPPEYFESGSAHSNSSCDNKESGSNEKRVNFEDNVLNTPSTSNQPIPEVQPVVEDGRHRYADYFAPNFTHEMIDFMTDPKNRGGKEWIPPKVKPTREELEELQRKGEEMARAVRDITPSDSENEEDSISSSSSDEGIGEMD